MDIFGQYMNWIEDFEGVFEISTEPYVGNYRLIEGLQPYKQKVGNTKLIVNFGKKRGNILTNGGYINPYYEFNHIAFLVKDWIKIQDSLEMIFNLLTGSSQRSLEILAYLRRDKISASSFGMYLYLRHRVILINRKDSSGLCKQDKILDLIDSLSIANIDVLIVGEDKYVEEMEKYTAKTNVYSIGKVVHPSGITLNSSSDSYYQTWYLFKPPEKPTNRVRNNYKPKKEKFKLSDFHCLKKSVR